MGAGCDALRLARTDPEKLCGVAEICQSNFGQEVAKHLPSVREFSIAVGRLMFRHDRAPVFPL